MTTRNVPFPGVSPNPPSLVFSLSPAIVNEHRPREPSLRRCFHVPFFSGPFFFPTYSSAFIPKRPIRLNGASLSSATRKVDNAFLALNGGWLKSVIHREAFTPQLSRGNIMQGGLHGLGNLSSSGEALCLLRLLQALQAVSEREDKKKSTRGWSSERHV